MKLTIGWVYDLTDRKGNTRRGYYRAAYIENGVIFLLFNRPGDVPFRIEQANLARISIPSGVRGLPSKKRA